MLYNDDNNNNNHNLFFLSWVGKKSYSQFIGNKSLNKQIFN